MSDHSVAPLQFPGTASTERAAFFTWLVVNSGKLPNNAYQRVQERLYTYVSQLAKDHAGAFPPTSDTAAFNLFRAAAQIGYQEQIAWLGHCTRTLTDFLPRLQFQASI